MNKPKLIIASVPVFVTASGLEIVRYIAGAAIDGDGSGGNIYGDPYFQADTSLRLNGKPLNPRAVPFVAIPPQIAEKTKGIVLGCSCVVDDLITELSVVCVVGDIGPRSKIGEMSIAAARALQIPWHPVTGGVTEKIFRYKLAPDVPAVVLGVRYKLQAFKG